MEEEFARVHDAFRLIGQDNLRRYTPLAHLEIRVHPDDSVFEVLARVLAARIAGCGIRVSEAPGARHPSLALLGELTASWEPALAIVETPEAVLADAIRRGGVERVRYAAPERVSEPVRRAAAEAGVHLATSSVLAVGRVELLHYLREQSLCVDYHRYGNLGARAGEERAPLA